MKDILKNLKRGVINREEWSHLSKADHMVHTNFRSFGELQLWWRLKQNKKRSSWLTINKEETNIMITHQEILNTKCRNTNRQLHI